MASSSSSSSSSLALSFPSSSLSQNWEHDVFPSFHGPDVRKAFLSHVLKEFRSKGINLFIDNEIKRGESIGPELIRAIRGSKISIVLLSKNYASSSWCLAELVEIMKRELGQTVITIFYEVDPTDVKKQTGDFGKAFEETCNGKTEEKIESWRKALEGASTIAGYHSSNWDDEATMIENIAVDISKMLNHLTPSHDFDHLIGMEAHMEKMKMLLRLDLDEVRMIGIWGPPGIGKTTIARFLFNQVSSSFQNSAIMVNIKGSYPRPCLDEYSAQLQLQKQMLSEMINQKDIVIPHLGVAQGRLRDRKVFLVLDDVDRSAQLDALAKNVQWFGPRSRIIITTEDLKLLMAHGINHIYKVKFPSTDEALQMFCMYAFDQKTPKDGFAELAYEITYLVGQLPLGLKVMGSHFRGLMSKQEWSMEVERLKTNLNGDIESILKFSYDALCDEDKDLFLHIACLFNYHSKKKVEAYLEESFKNVRQRLHVLAEKSLISIDNNYIKMHNLLEQLGKEIVRKQSVGEQRQFLVNDKDTCELITRSVIGIEYKGKLNITEKAFKRMANLQFLSVGYLSNISSLHYISPKLRLLDLWGAPVTSLPLITNLEFLVELRMVGSYLEKLWDGSKLLQNLKWMNLSNSINLKELPNLSTATSLKELNLRGCTRLVEIPSSIGNATNLQELDLGGCTRLVEIPSSIGNLHKLKKLALQWCLKLKTLPININMESLDSLDLRDCSSLKRFPEISTNIRVLDIIGTSIKEVPLSITSWSRLDYLRMPYCENLKEFPSIHNSIRELHLTDTRIQEPRPRASQRVRRLSSLIERVTKRMKTLSKKNKKKKEMKNLVSLPQLPDSQLLQELDPWVSGCSRLKLLVIKGMKNLVSLPQLPHSVSWIDAENCESLERLDCSFSNPNIHLNFANCFKLNKEARDLIIQTSTSRCAVLPGGEVPACFTYRASGSSVTVKLNQKPLRTSTKFKVCILFFNKDEKKADGRTAIEVSCNIPSKENALTARRSVKRCLYPVLKEHLYIFDCEAEEVTSTELVFEFKIDSDGLEKLWEIKECGILHLLEHHDSDEEIYDSDEEICERSSKQRRV